MGRTAIPKWKAYQGWRTDRKATNNKTRADRLAVLRKWADVIAVSQDERTTKEKRAAFYRGWTTAREYLLSTCWCCKERHLCIRHHVIQLQNGGNSHQLNLERICRTCHAEIHTWLATSMSSGSSIPVASENSPR